MRAQRNATQGKRLQRGVRAGHGDRYFVFSRVAASCNRDSDDVRARSKRDLIPSIAGSESRGIMSTVALLCSGVATTVVLSILFAASAVYASSAAVPNGSFRERHSGLDLTMRCCLCPAIDCDFVSLRRHHVLGSHHDRDYIVAYFQSDFIFWRAINIDFRTGSITPSVVLDVTVTVAVSSATGRTRITLEPRETLALK